MKISLDWLKSYVQIDESATELSEMLSNLGFPTESIETVGDDTVIDIEITSNRGDCLGHIGIAREICAATGRSLTLPNIELDTVKKDIADLVSVEIAAPSVCGRYTARVIESVKVGPSPDWMRKRLEAIGLRSVNNVVDATNYAMMETGQPPHAFDYDKICDGKIIVRKAEKDEKIVSIDGTNCQLTEDMLIIADSKQPVAIAGVMGGLDTEVSESTTTILLEEASFDPVTVRTASRRLSLPSDASYRFERIVDIEKIDFASARTAQLIAEVAGGKVVEGIVDVYPSKPETRQANLRLSRLKKVLGIEIASDKVMAILTSLSFEPKQIDSDTISCTSPTWRSDISREADLIEEIARVHGYDKVGLCDKISIEIAPVDSRQKITGIAGKYLNSCGFHEAITTSFSNAKNAKLISGKNAENHLAVTDITRKSENLLRNSLIGSLLSVVSGNINAGNKDIKLYEISDVFDKLKDGTHTENTSVCLICNSDFRILKGAVCGLIKTFNRNLNLVFKPKSLCWANAGAEIFIDGDSVGFAGAADKKVLNGFDIKNDSVCAAELNFDKLLALFSDQNTAEPLAKFPAIVRVLSVIVSEETIWQQLEEVINSNAPSELEAINFDGIYRGKPIKPGKKSVTISLRFRDNDGTLEHSAVDLWQEKIVSALSAKLSAELRQL